MFSPIGKKKVLLQQKFGGESSLRALSLSNDEASTGGKMLGSPSARGPGSPSARSIGSPMNRRLDSPGGSLDSTQSLREIRQKLKEQAPTSAIASTAKLEDALANVGLLGDVIRKIMDATARYRPERDSVMLKAFESRNIDYSLFRNYLNSVFWLTFTTDEYEQLLNYFDPTHTGIIDGYSFMKAFVRLNAIRKGREAQVIRERQEVYERNVKDEEERKRLEKEKRLLQGIDYHFSEEVRRAAMEKFENAAKKFDPAHPSAPSTAAFTVSTLKPLEFREMMKLIFNLKLDPPEAGAILKTFKADIENEIPATDFLKYFMRVGYEAREKEKAEQRKVQELLDQKAVEEKLKKAEELKSKLQYSVDYDFSENDENSALKKLNIAAEKYDKSLPGSVALDGFECEELSPLDFKELVRRVFNLVFTPAELGFIIQKYDLNKTSSVHCKTFITEFLQTGYEERHRKHIKQVEKQRKAIETAEKEHQEKMKSVRESEFVAFSATFEEEDLQTALKKLTRVSVFYDKSRGVTLSSFEPESLTLLEFKRGLKRTFNLEFTAKEMGAIFDYLQKDEDNKILCQPFLTLFITLGAAERAKIRTGQLNRQRSADVRAKEEAEKKKNELSSKLLYDVDFDFEPKDRDSAIVKMTEAATKYDPKHPAAMSLQSFEVKHMGGPEFKETVRRTFHLNFTAKEVGAVFAFIAEKVPEYDVVPSDRIHCGEFIKYFLQLGISERMRFHSEQLEKQRLEDAQREEANRQKLLEQANRGSYLPDMHFTEDDKKSILEKISIAAEKFDKNHPAAPSLEAFTAAYMYPGVFRENIKSIFGIKATPKEIGYLLECYDKEKSGKFSTKEFLIKFFALGKKIRDEKKRVALVKQRENLKKMQQENEEKLIQLIEKSDYEVDNDFTEGDFQEAVRRMTIASEKYDKMHPSAPNLDGFTGGPISAGAFRELMKRAFNIYLTPKEVGSLVHRFHTTSSLSMIDGKQFLIFFMKLGFDARARRKAQVMMNQRQAQMNLQQEQERKLLQSLARVELDITTTYTDTDREKALAKLTLAAALYDKNAPGSVSLDSFHCLYLTPGVFREVMKRTFNIVFSPSELAAMIAEFNNGSGNIDTSKFLVTFIKIGTEERDRAKALQLEKEKNNEIVRTMVEKKKKLEQEQKMLLKISYHYTPQQKEEAFRKLAAAAKKYDKAHPAAMTLDGFEEKKMKPHVFREMLKRTFNFTPSAEELGAIVHYFDQKNSGEIISQDFLIHFLKLGIAEREKEHKESLRRLKEDALLREKLHQDKMALQWAKAELNVEYDFTEEDRANALEKLTDASVKFDPASAGPMGLTAFHASVLSPAVFREMLRRVFRMQVTNGELAALIKEFDKGGNKQIDCADFLVKFQHLGNERKNQIRIKQLEKQRYMTQRYEIEMEEAKRKLDSKTEIELDFNFTREDFDGVMEKIRQLAFHYDKTHPAAPNLKGFQGADMKANEFKDMMMRTFHLPLSNKELAALFSYFPGIQASNTIPSPTASLLNETVSSTDDIDAAAKEFTESLNRAAAVGAAAMSGNVSDPTKQPRICNRDFLTYFYKVNREEMMKRNTQRIQKERTLKLQEKLRNDEIEQKKLNELILKLQFQPSDELSCLEKLKAASREYAIDSAPFIPLLQGFKGPALPPDKFREIFSQVFNLRFSMAEMGVLLSILDTVGLRMIDGTKFLNWFYKISRKMESFMLGESAEEVTLDMIKSDEMLSTAVNLTRASTASIGVSRVSTRGSIQFTSEKNRGTGASSPSIVLRSLSPSGKKKSLNFSDSNVDSGFDGSMFSRSESFEMDNPIYEGSISPLSGNQQNSFNLLPSPTHTDSSPIAVVKPRPIQVRHSSLEEENGSRIRKRPKGFGQLSLASVGSNDFDDFTIESNNVNTFARSTLSQQWFLPSIASTENSNDPFPVAYRDESGKAMREDLKELFERRETTSIEDYDKPSFVSGKEDSYFIGGGSIGTRGNNAEVKRVNVKTAPAPLRGNRRNKLKSMQSAPNLVIPNASYTQLSTKTQDSAASTGKDATSELKGNSDSQSPAVDQKASDSPDDFLTSIFNKSQITDASFTKVLPKGADPVAKLNKIASHLHNSPMAVVASKQKKQKPLDSKSMHVEEITAKLSSFPVGLPKKGSNKSYSNGTSEDSQPNGGFFFPTLLTSKIDGSSSAHKSTQPTLIDAPNIGIVGRSEVDPQFLKQIILS